MFTIDSANTVLVAHKGIECGKGDNPIESFASQKELATLAAKHSVINICAC